MKMSMEEFATWYNQCDYDRCSRTEELVFMQNLDSLVAADMRMDPATNYTVTKPSYDEYRAETEFEDVYVTICSVAPAESDYAAAPGSCTSGGAVVAQYHMIFCVKAKLVEQSTLSLFFMLFAGTHIAARRIAPQRALEDPTARTGPHSMSWARACFDQGFDPG